MGPEIEPRSRAGQDAIAGERLPGAGGRAAEASAFDRKAARDHRDERSGKEDQEHERGECGRSTLPAREQQKPQQNFENRQARGHDVHTVRREQPERGHVTGKGADVAQFRDAGVDEDAAERATHDEVDQRQSADSVGSL